MRISFLTLALLFLMPFACMADSPEEVMKNTAMKVSRAPMLTVKYNATSSEGGTTVGTLIISGRRFSMVGNGYGVWFNGEDLWSYSEQAGETNLSTPTPTELLEINPFDLINNYAKNYKLKGKNVKKNIYTIELQPVKKKSGIKSARLKVNTSTWLPEGIDVTFSSGTKIQISVLSASIDAGTPPNSLFEYPASQYPRVPVVDLR